MHNLWMMISRSVVSLTFSNASGTLTSGSGFRVARFLVTNNHVIQVPGATHVTLRSVRADGYTTQAEKTISYAEFLGSLLATDPEHIWDYAILKFPPDDFDVVPTLIFSPANEIKIGANVALFGFQSNQLHLSMHRGAISAQYFEAGVHCLQVDASFNHGYCGGPLVDAASKMVVGIVTRNATGLTAQFDELHRALQSNVRIMEAAVSSGEVIQPGNINYLEAILSSQVALDRLAREIARSANVGIGYAYHIQKLRAGLANLAW